MGRFSVPSKILLIAAAAFAARLAVTVFFADNRTLYFEHMLIAKNLLDGKGYAWDEWGRALLQPSSLVPPLYVYWCWLFQWLSSHNYFPMYVAQALVAASGCFPAFCIGRRLFSERVGLIFAAAYAFFPEFTFLHSKAVAESLYVVLVLWMVERYLALRDTPAGSTKTFGIALMLGVISGVAMLVKEGAAIVALAVLSALFVHFRRRRITLLSHILPVVSAVVVVLAPWMIRNAVVQGEFVPLRTAYGINWWVANHPGAAGSDRYADGKYVFSELPKRNPAYDDYMKRILPVDEQDRERAYAAEVIRFIRERPTEYLLLCARRLVHYVWFVPGHYLASHPVYRVSWILLLLVSLPGVVLAAGRRQLDPVFPLIILGFLLLYIPAIVLPRYRVITVLVLLMFAAVALDHWWALWKSRRTGTRSEVR